MYGYKRAKEKEADTNNKATQERVAVVQILLADGNCQKDDGKLVFDFQLDMDEEVAYLSLCPCWL